MTMKVYVPAAAAVSVPLKVPADENVRPGGSPLAVVAAHAQAYGAVPPVAVKERPAAVIRRERDRR